jgi:hypothetical protein
VCEAVTCNVCQGEIETGRDFELAHPDFAQHFPRMPREDGHPICDGCYQEAIGMVTARMMGPLKDRTGELIEWIQQKSGLPREWLELSDTQMKFVEANCQEMTNHE